MASAVLSTDSTGAVFAPESFTAGSGVRTLGQSAVAFLVNLLRALVGRKQDQDVAATPQLMDRPADDAGFLMVVDDFALLATQTWQVGTHERTALLGVLSVEDREFTAACREAVSIARSLPAGKFTAPSAELLALAKQAVQRQRERQGENVEAWAKRLAQDVGHLTD